MSPDPTPTPATTTFAVPRKQFDSVPRRRAIYIIAYALVMLLVYGPKVAALFGYLMPRDAMFALYGVGIVCYFVFCYHFIGTMKIMGYEPWMMLALGMIAVIPLPGVLVVAYMDRRIATAWDRADPDRESYRQKPASYE
jgi:hypothetical protein